MLQTEHLYVIIPASCKRIEEAAFSGCDSLKAVYFKGVPEEIDPSAFDQGVTIYGQEGSYIEDYALENKFTFVQWGDSAKSN